MLIVAKGMCDGALTNGSTDFIFKYHLKNGFREGE
jgi:hypothetical protein